MKPEHLDGQQTAKTKKASIVDGAGYNVAVGFGEQYVGPFAIRLGALPSEVAILSAVPAFVGALFQIVGAKLVDVMKDRKKIITTFVFLQALLFLPLFVVPFLTRNILLLTVIFSAYVVLGNLTIPAWNSLMGQVIEPEHRTKYFGRRGQITLFVMILSILGAGLVLTYFTTVNIWVGFGILFGIALAGRMVSWLFLLRHEEPQYVPLKEKLTLREFLQNLTRTHFGKFVIFRSLLAFSVMVAGPFFTVFMLNELHFTYLQYTIVVILPLIVRAFAMPYWAKASEKFGTRNIMYISALLVALIPAAWFIAGYFFAGSIYVMLIILCAELISGFGWAGVELTTLNYLLEASEQRKVATFSAYFGLIFGIGVLLGGLTGSFLATHLSIGINVLLAIMLISFILRFFTVLMVMPLVKEMKVHTRVEEGKLFFNLVVARPLGYAIYQTHNLVLTAGKGVSSATRGTQHAMDTVTKFVSPVFYDIFSYIDSKIEKFSPTIFEAKKKKKRERRYFYDIDAYIETQLRKRKR